MTRRVALVGSSGGHLSHLLSLQPWWAELDHFWVTFQKPDAVDALAGERVYWCYHPTNRSAWNLVRNTLLAIRVLRRERPDLVVSSGAAVAVPFFYVAKVLLRSTTIYVEVIDRVDTPTLSARLVRPVTDGYAVQWPQQLRRYPRATLIGRLL